MRTFEFGDLEENLDQLGAMLETGRFALDRVDVLLQAQDLLRTREGVLHPAAYLAFRRGLMPHASDRLLQGLLENAQQAWRILEKLGWHSVHAFIQAYIEHNDAGRLDWTDILDAVDQAEHGDRAGFDAFLEIIFHQGSIVVESPTVACSDCDAMVSALEAWFSARNPSVALCDSCVSNREEKGQAKRPRGSRTGNISTGHVKRARQLTTTRTAPSRDLGPFL